APADRRLQAGLTFARAQVAYPEPGAFARPPQDSRPPWLPRPRPGWLMALAVVFYSLTWAAWTRWHMVRRGSLLGVALLSGATALVLAAALAVECWTNFDQTKHPLVVIADDGVLLRKGNGEAYPRRYDTPLNRGVEARLLYARGDWLQIELASGEVGWVW